MVSVETTERALRPTAADLNAAPAGESSRRWTMPLMVLGAIFIISLGARLLAHDLVITADEDNWMRRAGGLTGLIVGLEPFLLGISQLVHMDAILSGCMVASVLAALIAWNRGGGWGWLVGSGVLAGLAILSKVPAVFLLVFVPALGVGLA